MLSQQIPDQPPSQRLLDNGMLLGLLVVLVGTVGPRLLLLGGLPATDEGVYAYLAQKINIGFDSGAGWPKSGGLSLYPLLVHWVFDLSGNHLVLLRLADLVVAALASWLFFLVLVRESGSRRAGAVIAAFFLLVMNHPVFIQYGFKNSIFAAYIPLLLALLVWQRPTHGTATWLLCGALIAIAVLLRETFLHFMLASGIAVLLGHGWRAFIPFSVGAAVTGLGIVLLIGAARGDVGSIVTGYTGLAGYYAEMASQRGVYFAKGALTTLRHAISPLLLAATALLFLVFGSLARGWPVSARRPAFWLLIAIVPLVEPALKYGFPYHFAVCLGGLAGLTALGWRRFGEHSSATRRVATGALLGLVAVALLLPVMAPLRHHLPTTLATLQAFPTARWPDSMQDRCNYVLAAHLIDTHASPDATLSVSGFMHALFPLTGLRPPAPELAHLNHSILRVDKDSARLAAMLTACPPDLIFVTTRMDSPGAALIAGGVALTGQYQLVAEIPARPGVDYGAFSGTLHRRVASGNRTCDLAALRATQAGATQ